MNNLMQDALRYAAKGWHIFPCRERDGDLWVDDKGLTHLPRAKTPRIKGGLLNATTNEAQVREWWGKWPYAAIGMNCGKSGLFAFDLDCKNGKQGWENFRDMGIVHNGALHSQTPTYGMHIIYTGSGKSSTNDITGIDTRGEGGYIILPPSELDGKGVYFQCDDWERVPVALDPDVLKRIFPPREHREPAAHSTLSTSEEYARAKKAIAALSNDRASDYSEWVKVGMALRNLGGDGLRLYHEFSRKSADKYNPDIVNDKWEKLSGSSITLGTLYYYANQDKSDWWKE